MLPGGKEVIARFLYPRIPKGLPSAYPPYPTEEDGMVFLGNSHYQTGYVRNYVNPNQFFSLGNKKWKSRKNCHFMWNYDFAL